MKDKIKLATDKIIRLAKEKPNEYINIVLQEWQLPNSLEDIFVKSKVKYKVYISGDLPRAWLIIDFEPYRQGNFNISYEYHLMFTKFDKLYKQYFTYKIDNKDPNGTVHNFFGEVYQPLTKQQEILQKQVDLVLSDQDYCQLSYNELVEVILGLEFGNESMKFFGPQPTVDMLLFKDVFCLVPNY